VYDIHWQTRAGRERKKERKRNREINKERKRERNKERKREREREGEGEREKEREEETFTVGSRKKKAEFFSVNAFFIGRGKSLKHLS
jgi:hypothetical protein